MVSVETTKASDYKRIEEIYLDSFPKSERKPFPMLISGIKKGSAEMLSVFSDGMLCGFTYVYFHDGYALIDYFAMAEIFRGKGTGSKAMKKICERYKDRHVFLEIEQHSAGDIERRRMEFYRRCGYELCGINVCLFGVDMELMTYKCGITKEDYIALYVDMTNNEFVLKNVIVK